MDKLVSMFWYLKDRWNEPSTHAALSAVCGSLSIQVNEGIIQSFFTLATIAFGAAGFFVKEAKPVNRVN